MYFVIDTSIPRSDNWSSSSSLLPSFSSPSLPRPFSSTSPLKLSPSLPPSSSKLKASSSSSLSVTKTKTFDKNTNI